MNNRILVTGGTGFIGYYSVLNLVERGFEVVVSTTQEPKVRIEGVTYLVCDLTDTKQVNHLVGQAGADTLLHVAWKSAAGSLWASPENIIWLKASLDLGQAFLGCWTDAGRTCNKPVSGRI